MFEFSLLIKGEHTIHKYVYTSFNELLEAVNEYHGYDVDIYEINIGECGYEYRLPIELVKNPDYYAEEFPGMVDTPYIITKRTYGGGIVIEAIDRLHFPNLSDYKGVAYFKWDDKYLPINKLSINCTMSMTPWGETINRITQSTDSRFLHIDTESDESRKVELEKLINLNVLNIQTKYMVVDWGNGGARHVMLTNSLVDLADEYYLHVDSTFGYSGIYKYTNDGYTKIVNIGLPKCSDVFKDK